MLNCSWGPDEQDAALIAKAPELVAMLRELEEKVGYWEPGCAVCYTKAHKPDCRLAKLLKELP